MELKTAEQRYREFLDTLPISTLRIVGRRTGVVHPSSNNKGDLIDAIVAILTGKRAPAPPSNRGAPAKQTYIDPAIVRKLEEIRSTSEAQSPVREGILEVASGYGDAPSHDEPVYTGILEITSGGYGFLRAKNCQPSTTGEDVFLSAPFIRSAKLREGDSVACNAQPRQKNESASISRLLSVNGLPVGKYEQRPHFDALTAQYPDEKIALSEGGTDLSLRILDLFAPIGKGQRALIVAPPKAGKTTLLKTIARSIGEHRRDLVLIVLLIDERPEEVTDMRESVPAAEIVSSTFDEGAEHHVRAAHLVIEHAKRHAELGRDVVILLDSLTKLTRAYNELSDGSGKILSGGLNANALIAPKQFFGTARKTKEAGSVTILATVLVDTGSRMDEVINEEFKGTGNSDIFLSRELAERRIFPAIDIRRSGTRKEELLLTKEELSAVYRLRERGLTETAGLIEMMQRTENNEKFIACVPEWLRVYKKER